MENFRLKTLLLIFLGISYSIMAQSSFSLSSYRVYSTNENAVFNLNTYNISGKMLFRVYSIENPKEFFEKQKDIHEPDILGVKKRNSFDFLDESFKKVFNDLRSASRRYIESDARKNIRDVFDIVRSKPTEKTQNIFKEKKQDFKLIKEWDYEVTNQTKEYNSNYYNIDFPIKSAGVYLIEGRYKNLVGYTCLIVSDNVLITKRINEKLLIFGINRKTGIKISGLKIDFFENSKKKESKELKDGTCEFTINQMSIKDKIEDEWTEMDDEINSEQYFLFGGDRDNFIIYDASGGYYYSDDGNSDKFISYFYTDRPIYRPGQEVFFKGMIFVKDATFQPKNKSDVWVNMKVSDQNDELVKKDSFKTNQIGSFNGSFKLPLSKSLGFYSVNLTIGNQNAYYSFEVQEYKKPEYKVDVSFDKSRYSGGDVITGNIKARYFFGSPVKNSKVEIYIMTSRFYRYSDDEDMGFSIDDEDYSPYSYNILKVESSTLDENGIAKFEIQTQTDDTQDLYYIVKANVEDNSRRLISGSKRVLVTRGDYYVKSNPDKYVYTVGDKVNLNTEVFDFSDAPVLTDYSISFKKVYYEKVETITNGVKSYSSQEKTKDFGTLQGKSLKDGISMVTFQPKEDGFYKYFVTVYDKNGKKITEEFSFYVSSYNYGSDWYSDDYIKIIPSKKNYDVGEKINFMIISPISNIDVLISAEGEDIYEYRVEHLESKTKIIEFEIKQKYVPNFYITVNSYFGEAEISGTRKINISPKEKFLDVNISFDKKEYKPQDDGVITVEVKDKNGKPISDAEVSCGVVDEAIYSIREESAEDIKKGIYAVKWNKVQTNNSAYFYFDGRSRWVERDESSDLLPTFKKNMLSNKIEDRKKIFKGDVKGAKIVVENVRRDFRDLALWSPNVYTNGSGIAKINIKFPDNLTTWRSTVRVLSEDAAVGSNISKIISKKNLMVTMETPRFYVEGDNSVITTQVHNQTEYDQYINLQLQGDGISIEGSQVALNVPKFSSMSYDWKVNPAKLGVAKLKASAFSSNDKDIMEVSIPVIEYGIKNTLTETMNLNSRNNSSNRNVIIPANTNPESIKLKFNVTPSLASAFLTSLDDLIGYPYGCVEQTMSRFLPTVIVSGVLDKINLPFDEKKKKEIPRMVAKGLEKISSMVNSEGAWGWWEGDASNPYMTAYVVYGLKLAQKNGFDVNNRLISEGCNYLNKVVNDQKVDIQTRAYVLYVLSNTNYYDSKKQKAYLIRIANEFLVKNREPLTLSLISNAMNNFGYTQESVETAKELVSKATFVSDLMFWKMNTYDYTFRTDEIEMAAFGAEALIKNRFSGQQIDNVINYLLNSRIAKSWNSTKQTALIIYSLADYLVKTKELEPNYKLKLFVNNSLVKTLEINKSNLFTEALEVDVEKKYLKGNNIAISSKLEGNGKSYITFSVDYFDKRSEFLSQSSGIELQKEYFKLVRVNKDGNIYYVKEPVGNSIKSGDLIFVKMKVNSNLNLQYMMIEDPIFAGGEVLNDRDFLVEGENYFANSSWQYRWGYFTKEVRDQKVSFFVSYFDRSSSDYYYIIRAQIPGNYSVMPAISQLMYYPKVRGITKNEKISVNF